MIEIAKKILNDEGIYNIGFLPITECAIINERILPQGVNSAIMFSIPYRTSKNFSNDGFSEYVHVYDYHKYAQELFNRILEPLNKLTGNIFYGFCDHSPINEKMAIAKCGLGTIGRNSLFIDKDYGSFVFIVTILTDAFCNESTHSITLCSNCQKCVLACPNEAITDNGIDRSKCLSAISQKKSKSDEEKLLLKRNNVIWGCDICQKVCPYNENAKISPIQALKDSKINKIDKAFLDSLSDDEFSKFAFSYKGRKLINDNLEFK